MRLDEKMNKTIKRYSKEVWKKSSFLIGEMSIESEQEWEDNWHKVS